MAYTAAPAVTYEAGAAYAAPVSRYTQMPTTTYATSAPTVTYAAVSTNVAAPTVFTQAAAPVTYSAAAAYAATSPLSQSARSVRQSPLAQCTTQYQAKVCKRVEDIDDRVEMTRFLKRACATKNCPEYVELYRFLMNVFKRADRDYDGLVGAEDFDLMVEMAGAIPRKFAFAPTSLESFATDSERTAYRAALFGKIDVDKSSTISFDEWLNYCYGHIKEMTATIDEKSVDLGFKTPQGFLTFCVKACMDRRSPEYKELYDMLFKIFIDADADKDGRVNPEEFDAMIEIAAEIPRKFGYAPPAEQTYRSAAERKGARNQMFRAMDSDNNGTITFEEWLTFTYKHICQKVQPHSQDLTGVPPQFVRGGAGRCPYGFD